MNWYWCVILPTILVNCYELLCEKNPEIERKNDSLPKTLALKGNYKVGLSYRNILVFCFMFIH